jgi:hypothetical protein
MFIVDIETLHKLNSTLIVRFQRRECTGEPPGRHVPDVCLCPRARQEQHARPAHTELHRVRAARENQRVVVIPQTPPPQQDHRLPRQLQTGEGE